jgi:hypothetical protein
VAPAGDLPARVAPDDSFGVRLMAASAVQTGDSWRPGDGVASTGPLGASLRDMELIDAASAGSNGSCVNHQRTLEIDTVGDLGTSVD